MESLSNDWYDLASNIGPQLPSLLTSVICLVFVLLRWKRHPKVSLVAALGLVLLILHTLAFAVADVWLPRYFPASAEQDTYFLIFGLAGSVSLAIAFSVLLVAIFMDRKTPEPEG